MSYVLITLAVICYCCLKGVNRVLPQTLAEKGKGAD